jgi:hypothetical protein
MFINQMSEFYYVSDLINYELKINPIGLHWFDFGPGVGFLGTSTLIGVYEECHDFGKISFD